MTPRPGLLRGSKIKNYKGSNALGLRGHRRPDFPIEKYRAETIDIEDVEFEEVDLEFDSLFPDPKINENGDPQK